MCLRWLMLVLITLFLLSQAHLNSSVNLSPRLLQRHITIPPSFYIFTTRSVSVICVFCCNGAHLTSSGSALTAIRKRLLVPQTPSITFAFALLTCLGSRFSPKLCSWMDEVQKQLGFVRLPRCVWGRSPMRPTLAMP